MVHAGPFANIAVGQSSIIADRVGLKLFDYHVTESGFGADIGFEKFWNVKCRFSGLKPHVSVLTTTIRAPQDARRRSRKSSPVFRFPKTTPKRTWQPGWKTALPNMVHHINTINKSGINPVVCINAFHTDTKEEIDLVRRACGSRRRPLRGVQALGQGRRRRPGICRRGYRRLQEKPNDFKFLYPDEMKLRERVETIVAKEVYGADGVDLDARSRSQGQDA